jgi:hypothetical protein
VLVDCFAWFSLRQALKGIGLLAVKQEIKIDPSIFLVIHASSRVLLALRNTIKDVLDHMDQKGVIGQTNEPTAWVYSMMTVLKLNRKLLVCRDPKDLNRTIRREQYLLKIIEDVT